MPAATGPRSWTSVIPTCSPRDTFPVLCRSGSGTPSGRGPAPWRPSTASSSSWSTAPRTSTPRSPSSGAPASIGSLAGCRAGWARGLVIPPPCAGCRRPRFPARPPPSSTREVNEWREGHIPDAVHIPGAQLPNRIEEVPAGPLLVICGSGYRSAIAASLLARAGRDEVAHVVGGMDAYRSAGQPVATDTPAMPAEVR